MLDELPVFSLTSSSTLTVTWKILFYHADIFSHSFVLFDHLAYLVCELLYKKYTKNIYISLFNQ